MLLVITGSTPGQMGVGDPRAKTPFKQVAEKEKLYVQGLPHPQRQTWT